MSDYLLPKPWRKSKYFDSKVWTSKVQIRQWLKDDIISYKPLHELMPLQQIFPRVNMLLFGPVGGGKSSVFNTISSIFSGKIFNIARCGRSTESVTKKLTKFQVMYGGIGEQLRLSFWDTKGIDDDNLMTSQNMRYLLEGNLPDRYPLDPSGEISSQSPGFIHDPSLLDVVHCVVTVVDASKTEEMEDDVHNNICEMQSVMNGIGVPHVLLLTNIDKVSQLSLQDATKIFKSQKLKESVDEVSELFGLPRNAVFVMKCYEEECCLDNDVDITALVALKGILDYCDAYLYRMYDDVIAIASKQATREEENKTLKEEHSELKSINDKYKIQHNIRLAKMQKARNQLQNMPLRRDPNKEQIMLSESLQNEIDEKKREIAKLEEEKKELNKVLSSILQK